MAKHHSLLLSQYQMISLATQAAPKMASRVWQTWRQCVASWVRSGNHGGAKSDSVLRGQSGGNKNMPWLGLWPKMMARATRHCECLRTLSALTPKPHDACVPKPLALAMPASLHAALTRSSPQDTPITRACSPSQITIFGECLFGLTCNKMQSACKHVSTHLRNIDLPRLQAKI